VVQGVVTRQHPEDQRQRQAGPYRIGDDHRQGTENGCRAGCREHDGTRPGWPPASIRRLASAMPSFFLSRMNSSSTMEFRTTMPARAITRLMDVALKYTPVSAKPGMMPIIESGMAAMMTTGIVKDRNLPTSRR